MKRRNPLSSLTENDIARLKKLVSAYIDTQHPSGVIVFMDCYTYVKERTLMNVTYNTVSAILKELGYQRRSKKDGIYDKI